jgi:uncharacterized protein YcfJ
MDVFNARMRSLAIPTIFGAVAGRFIGGGVGLSIGTSIGSTYGIFRADQKYLADRGIYVDPLQQKFEISPEAKMKYFEKNAGKEERRVASNEIMSDTVPFLPKKEVSKNRLKHSVLPSIVGGLAGAIVAPKNKQIGALTGASLGILYGSLKGDEKYLANKGIYKGFNDVHLSQEARKKYLNNKEKK